MLSCVKLVLLIVASATWISFTSATYRSRRLRFSNDYRLPTDLKPTYYRLDIITNIADLNRNYTFEGKVWIKINCIAKTSKIIMHAKDLDIDFGKVKVYKIDSEDGDEKVHEKKDGKSAKMEISIKDQLILDDMEFYIIILSEPLTPGSKYSVYIPYMGALKPALAGYYRSSYTDMETGQTKWIAITQFESTDARRGLPCFDEPAFKAVFQVNLGHIDSKLSASNMPIAKTEPIDDMKGWVWDKYHKTVPMSTYLLAFMVTNFEFKESATKGNNVTFRVWARKDAIGQVDWAAQVGPQILKFFETYFDVKYPLPKQDMVAVPDFGSGAMENWGLITYREVALLFDPKVSPATSKVYVASVIGHELAHQWFGNLVTMKWWTDLWLNEGFATYVSTLGLNHIHPEWDSMNADAVTDALTVFSLDALESSHPVSVTIGHPNEIAEMFDMISYKKGAFLLRMMNYFLGEETFRIGVSKYLKKHAYGNAEQDDLWKVLSDSAHESKALPSNMTVKTIMDKWTLQMGYPALTVTRDYTAGTAKITQDWFLVGMSSSNEKTEKVSWPIPLSYTTETKADFKTSQPTKWMDCKETEVSGLPNDQWVIFNIQLGSLYRIQYDDDNYNMIIKTLRSNDFEKIHVLNRVQLIDDAMNFARAGDVSYNLPFKIISYLDREMSFLPWTTAMNGIGFLNKMLSHTNVYGPFKARIRQMLTPIYEKIKRIKYDNIPENLMKVKHQTLILSSSCHYNVGDCRRRAVKKFAEWMKSQDPDKTNPIPKDFTSYVYCNAIQAGSEDEWNFLWKRYLNSNVGTEKTEMLIALSCTKEIWLLNRYLEWCLREKSGIRKQDSHNVIAAVAQTGVGFYIAKSFLRNRFSDITDYYDVSAANLGRIMTAMLNKIKTPTDLHEFKDLLKQHERELAPIQKTIGQGIEQAKLNIKWHETHYGEMTTIFNDKKKRASCI